MAEAEVEVGIFVVIMFFFDVFVVVGDGLRIVHFFEALVAQLFLVAHPRYNNT